MGQLAVVQWHQRVERLRRSKLVIVLVKVLKDSSNQIEAFAAYYPNQDPSGSSSGSGVSSSIGLALACLGSEVSLDLEHEHHGRI